MLNLQINDRMRVITLDIKNMCVNLLISGIMHTAQYWLSKHNNYNKQLNEQTLNMLCTIIKQNCFQYEGQIYQP